MNMKVAFLATLVVVLFQCAHSRKVTLQALLAAVPDTPNEVQGHQGSHVSGPISSHESVSGVQKTDDMQLLAAIAEGEVPKETKEKARGKKNNSVLTDAGNADKVPLVVLGSMSSGRKGMHLWNILDLTQPLCRNCKALVDYELLLNEYGNVFGTQAFLVILAIALVWTLGTTASDFFLPPLLYWSERLQLPPEIAGATLLALGNGAPDVFAVVAAADKGDLPLALSEMLGSNMFTLCVTGSVIALSCGSTCLQSAQGTDPIPMSATFCQRLTGTVCIYFVALSALAYILTRDHPTASKIFALPCLYGVYVFMLWTLRDKKDDALAPATLEAPACERGSEDDGQPELTTLSPLAGLSMPKETSALQMTYWILSLPSYVVRWMCIPPADHQWDSVRRAMSAIAPLRLLAFCAITNVARMQEMNFISFLGFGMLACLAGISLYLCSDNRATLPWFYPIIPFFAMIASMLWMSVLASEITALVEAIGFTSHVPRLRLGFTAIAWGNCLADLVVCLATVRRGHAMMAITAIFAGPLIDDLVAFGLAMIIVTWERGSPMMCGADCPMDFKAPLITSLFFVAAAVVMLVFTIRARGTVARLGAFVLLAWYATFLIIVLFVQHVDAPEAVVVRP